LTGTISSDIFVKKGFFMIEKIICPICGHITEQYKNPFPTVDVIVEIGGKIVLVNRKNPPYGWAIPGGFIDYGESAEEAAAREIKEETGLDVTDLTQFHVYSDPNRDLRFHTITIVFTAKGNGSPLAGDDAAGVGIFGEDELPAPLALDHARILSDYFRGKRLAGENNP
jgi:ADP-ribose pyrophosphatase YjhB (NUDIX family)